MAKPISDVPVMTDHYSDQNKLPANQVTVGQSQSFKFHCDFCYQIYQQSPNNINRAGKLFPYRFCCKDDRCIEKQKICRRKERFLASDALSFARCHPKLANEFIKWVNPLERGLLTLDQVPNDTHKEAWWRCSEHRYHIWKARIANRWRFPKCPFCLGGNKAHIRDSVYVQLKQHNMLNYLHPDDHKISMHSKTGSETLFRFKCRVCSEPNYRIYKQFIDSVGCKECCDRARSRRERLIKEQGTIADHEFLLQQYCYDQPDIPDDKCNILPPEQVNCLSHKSVHWRCPRGHFTTAPSKHRYEGRVCKKCTQRQSSLSECLIYHELKSWLVNYEVQHRATIAFNEVDVLIKKDDVVIGVEYDGFRWHKDKASEDNKKDRLLVSHLTLIRMREQKLPKLDKTPYIINVNASSKVGFLKAYSSLTKLLASILNIPVPVTTEFLQYDLAASYFYELSVVPKEKSAATLCPKLVTELDKEKTTLSLDNLTPGADITLPWLCSACDYTWATPLYHRTTGGTGCPACANQVVSSKNSILACYPEQASYFDHPNKFVPGSSIKTRLVCSYPHRNTNGSWDKTGPICGAPMKRSPLSVFTQLDRSGHIWCRSCKHPGHSKTDYKSVGEKNSQNLLDKKKLRIKNKFSENLWKELPETIQNSILSPEQQGLTCPNCGLTNNRGKTETVILQQIFEDKCFLCMHCLGSGIPINPNMALNRNATYRNAKFVSYQLEKKGWRVSPAPNILGLTYAKAVFYLEAFNIEKEHYVKLPLKEWSIWIRKRTDECPCDICKSKVRIELEKSQLKTQENNRFKIWLDRYPNGSINLIKNARYQVSCGMAEKINGDIVPHPSFIITGSNIERLQEKNKHLCLTCAIRDGERAPSINKSLEQAQYLWTIHAELLGQTPLELPYPESQSSEALITQIIKTRTQKLIAKCGYISHKLCVSTYDNLLRANHQGYCPECLRNAGVARICNLNQYQQWLNSEKIQSDS